MHYLKKSDITETLLVVVFCIIHKTVTSVANPTLQLSRMHRKLTNITCRNHLEQKNARRKVQYFSDLLMRVTFLLWLVVFQKLRNCYKVLEHLQDEFSLIEYEKISLLYEKSRENEETLYFLNL